MPILSRFAITSIVIILTIVIHSAAFAESVWPECQVRTRLNGGPSIIIDGEARPPLMFAINNQFGRDEVNFDEMRLAHKAGVDLFGCIIRLDWLMSPEERAAIIAKFMAVNPDGYFYVQVWMGASHVWGREHPGECLMDAKGEVNYDFASPASELWRMEASNQLRTLIDGILTGPYAARFMGVELQYLNTAEWFYPEADGYWDYSEASRTGFRAWLRREHGELKTLRQAWGQPEATFDDAAIPSPELRAATAWGPFRDPVAHRAAMDYERYLNEVVPDAIACFARVAKDATRGRSLVAAFYGYTMELNGNGPRALSHSGHLGLGRLLTCPDLDIIRAPYSYFDRKIGQPSHIHSPGDSFALHGKLGIYDDDTYTHISIAPEEHLMAPGWPDRTVSLEQTLAVNARNFGNFIGRGCGLAQYDLLSDGRWNAPEIWEQVGLFRDIATRAAASPPFLPEVAVLMDEAGVHTLGDATRPWLMHSLYWWRYELDRIGTPVGYYLQQDAALLPASTRVILLANAYRVSPELLKELRRRANAGAMIIWTWAAGVWEPEGADPAHIQETVGVGVRADFQEGPFTFDSGAPMELEATFIPRLYADDPGVEVLARYSTGEACAVIKPEGEGWTVWLAAPRMSSKLLRDLCQRAGTHLYRDSGGMCAVTGDTLIVHTSEEGPLAMSWPRKDVKVTRLLPPATEPMIVREGEWIDALPAGTTAIYRCGY